MERLFTSITNAEEAAERVNNDLYTGYYAGEREDYMMNGINMTENGLIKENVPVKVALDHGWSSIKGEHIFMETSVVPVDYTPLTNHGLLEYKGQKYIIGQGRLGKQATKTENENYFLLTLAGIAKELHYQRKVQTEHVELYAGVPLTLFGAERKEFRDYLWHKERISFTFEGVHYSFFMDKVKIYAQCYAAIANRMGDMDRLRCVDIGSWTMDVLSVRERIPMDKDAYTYELGLITAITSPVTLNLDGAAHKISVYLGGDITYTKTYSFRKTIDKVEVTGVTEPVVGQAPTTDGIKVPADANYYIGSVSWWNIDTSQEATVFEDGYEYGIVIPILSKEGYEIALDAVILLDGEEGYGFSHSTGDASISKEYSLKTAVDEIKFDNVPELKVGETVKDMYISQEGAKYAVSIWYEVWNDTTQSYEKFTGVIESGKAYNMYVEARMAQGFCYDEDVTKVYVNGKLTDDLITSGNWVLYRTRFSSGLKVIDKVEITIDKPVAGNHSSIEPVATVPDGANYSVDAEQIYWLLGNNERYTYLWDNYFEEGKSYGVDFSLYADEGYVFADDLVVVVNGVALAFDDYKENHSGKTSYINYFFNTECSHIYTDDADDTCNACGYKRNMANNDENSSEGIPPTGDSFNVQLMLMVVVMAAGVVVSARAKNRKGNEA